MMCLSSAEGLGLHLSHLEDSMVGGYNHLKAHSLICSVAEERKKNLFSGWLLCVRITARQLVLMVLFDLYNE